MKNILLVEDDLVLADTIKDILEDEGFDVTWAKDGNEALELTFKNRFDLYLFDINIPFIDGFELLKSLRDGHDSTPAIFITALRDITSFTKGFDMGADEYIKKPFDANELIVRIHALIKKSYHSYSSHLVYKDLIYDIKKELLYKGDEQIHLTPSEHQLFILFLKNIDTVLSKDTILYHLHNNEIQGSDAALRVQISKLKKLGLSITNIRAIGYRCEKV